MSNSFIDLTYIPSNSDWGAKYLLINYNICRDGMT